MLIDAFMANDEVALVRYRLRQHAPIARRVVIAEANVTMTGFPKRMHIREALTSAELSQYGIRLVTVPFALDLSHSTLRNASSAHVMLMTDTLASESLPRTPHTMLAALRVKVDREGVGVGSGGSNVNSALRYVTAHRTQMFSLAATVPTSRFRANLADMPSTWLYVRKSKR